MEHLNKIVTINISSNENTPHVSTVFLGAKEIFKSDAAQINYTIGALRNLYGSEMTVESQVLKRNPEDRPRVDYKIKYGEDVVAYTSDLKLYAEGKQGEYSHVERGNMATFRLKFKFCPRPPWC